MTRKVVNQRTAGFGLRGASCPGPIAVNSKERPKSAKSTGMMVNGFEQFSQVSGLLQFTI